MKLYIYIYTYTGCLKKGYPYLNYYNSQTNTDKWLVTIGIYLHINGIYTK